MPSKNDLDALARSLRYNADVVPKKARDAVQASAKAIKAKWADDMRDISHYGHIPHLPAAIGYSTRQTAAGAHAEIGIDYRARQGPLGHFIEFGSVNNPPHFLGEFAMLAEEPRFVKNLEDAIEDL